MRKDIAGLCVGASALVGLGLSGFSASAWEPTKPIEIVVPAGAGGATDQMARMIQAAVQKNNLMKQPMVVTLKPGASGAEGLMYMKASEGDPNKFIITSSVIYTLPFSAKIPFNWRDLTPVSIIAFDQFVLWTNSQLPYKTVKEFIEGAKAAKPPFKMGGTGSKREDHILTAFMEIKTGAKLVYLPYKSGGEAATQLVGNHTQGNVNNPSENIEVWRANQVRALCLFDDERISYKSKVTETHVLERHSDVQGRRPGHGIQHDPRHLHSAQDQPGAGGVLRRPVQEAGADAGIQGVPREAGPEALHARRRRHGQVPREG